MASAWKYGNTMNADIKKTINKIIFTQAKTFSKALIKRLNTTAWVCVGVLDAGPDVCTETAERWRKEGLLRWTEGTLTLDKSEGTAQVRLTRVDRGDPLTAPAQPFQTFQSPSSWRNKSVAYLHGNGLRLRFHPCEDIGRPKKSRDPFQTPEIVEIRLIATKLAWNRPRG